MFAILEVDDAQITERIYKAIAAIELRRLSPWKIDCDEKRALDAADEGIKALVTERTEKLVWSVRLNLRLAAPL